MLTLKSHARLNEALDARLHSVFSDLSQFTNLSAVFPAAHTFQIFLVLLANVTFNAKPELLVENSVIGSAAVQTSQDLGRFTASLTSSTVLANIINFDLPFNPSPTLVHQALQGLHSGPTIMLRSVKCPAPP